MVKHASVQAFRLGIQAIEHGVVTSSEGEYHAVLEVTGSTSPFEDDAHQEAVLAGFSTFLNGLSYPIQILVRASPVDLSGYVTYMEDRGRQALDPQLAELAHDHAMYVQKLARVRTLLERRFYLVVAAATPARRSWSARWLKSNPERAAAPRRDAARHQLTFRCEDLSRQLGRCGLGVRRLSDLELAQLYLTCWGPERSRLQRFRQQLEDYSTLAVKTAQRGLE